MRFKKENIIRGTVVASAIFIGTTTPFCVSNKDENSNDGYCLKESVKSESYDFEEASIELMSNYVVKLSDEDSSVKSKLNSEKVKKEKKKEYKNYYTKANLRLRKKPTLDSDVMEIVGFNKKLKACKLNKDWYEVRYEGNKYYASADYISKNKMKYKSFSIPNHSDYTGKKTWMPYTAITNRSSKQYKLQKLCSTGNYGIRTYNGRYCVALGSHFKCEIGQYFDIVLKNGTVIECIMSDLKANKHTDSNNIFTTHSNCCSEFVVNKRALDHNAKRDGDLSSVCDEWDSKVVKIKVYDKTVELN